MNIQKSGKAGTLESNDCMIMVMPSDTNQIDKQIDIQIESIVMKQFGDAIRKEITETLERLGVTACTLIAKDKGALDYTIRARVETAIMRAMEDGDNA